MSAGSPVVVGVDGSEGADLALRWAAATARAQHSALRLVHASSEVDSDNLWPSGRLLNADREQAGQQAAKLLAAAERHVGELAPDVRVTTFYAEQPPARALTAEALHAGMVVVGSRRPGGGRYLGLGSVAATIAQRAACPVVVVRGAAGDPVEGARVVVGIDGRHNPEVLLEFAFAHAAAMALPLYAVLCWRPEALTEMSWRPVSPPPVTAQEWLSEALAGWREKYPDVSVQVGAVRDWPVHGLVEQARSDELLVIGRHGRRVLPGVVLGSTAMGVLHHATCPVALVPEA